MATAVETTPQLDRAQSTESGNGRALVRRQRMMIAGIVAIVIILYGIRRTPSNPAEQLSLVGNVQLEPLGNRQTIRVGTFNIHAGVGRDRQFDLRRTAACIRDLDILALQEVRGTLLGLRENQAKTVGDRVHMASLFIPTEWSWYHNHYGNGLLTRIPLEVNQRIPLVNTDHRGFRNAVLSRFQFQDQTVNLLSTHVDATEDREIQLKAVVDLYLSLDEPSILMGDLNSEASHEQMQRLLATPGVDDALTGYPRTDVLKAPIDWIITRGLRTVDAAWIENPASDHPLVWAELVLDVEEID